MPTTQPPPFPAGGASAPITPRAPQIEEVGPTGIYPASGPFPPSAAEIRGQGELAHPEEREHIKGIGRWLSAERAALLFGRAVFGGYFLYNGINHFVNHRMMTDYARSKGVPLPGTAVATSGAIIVLGGLSILSGTRPKVGASLVTTFLVAVSPQMHAFWRLSEQAERMQEMVNFTKNAALIGAAALVAAVPEPWPAALHVGRTGALVKSTDIQRSSFA
jgi:putative oxidoreductase